MIAALKYIAMAFVVVFAVNTIMDALVHFGGRPVAYILGGIVVFVLAVAIVHEGDDA